MQVDSVVKFVLNSVKFHEKFSLVECFTLLRLAYNRVDLPRDRGLLYRNWVQLTANPLGSLAATDPCLGHMK